MAIAILVDHWKGGRGLVSPQDQHLAAFARTYLDTSSSPVRRQVVRALAAVRAWSWVTSTTASPGQLSAYR
jgi:hypothetical protein